LPGCIGWHCACGTREASSAGRPWIRGHRAGLRAKALENQGQRSGPSKDPPLEIRQLIPGSVSPTLCGDAPRIHWRAFKLGSMSDQPTLPSIMAGEGDRRHKGGAGRSFIITPTDRVEGPVRGPTKLSPDCSTDCDTDHDRPPNPSGGSSDRAPNRRNGFRTRAHRGLLWLERVAARENHSDRDAYRLTSILRRIREMSIRGGGSDNRAADSPWGRRILRKGRSFDPAGNVLHVVRVRRAAILAICAT